MKDLNLYIKELEALFNKRKFLKVIEKCSILERNIPKNFYLSFFKGSSFLGINDFERAEIYLKKAIDIKPNNVISLYNLSLTLRNKLKYKESLDLLFKALNLNKENHHIKYEIANHYYRQKKYLVALNFYSEIYEHLKFSKNFINFYSDTLVKLGYLDKGILICEDYVKYIKKDSDVLNRLGIYYKNKGFKNKAIEKFEECLKQTPKNIKAHLNLSEVVNYSLNDYNFNTLMNLKNQTFDDEALAYIYFALSKAFRQKNDIQKYIVHLIEANKFMKKIVKFDILYEKKIHKITKNALNQITFMSPEITSNRDIQPIFIVGMPRSGTTLIENIISAHSEVQGLGELDYINDLVNSMLNFKSDSQKKILLNDLQKLNDIYFENVRNLNLDKSKFTDKMPLNFRWINIINKAIPNAKFIHVFRNPIANCWSIYNVIFTSKGNRFSYSQKDLFKFYNLYLEILKDWTDILGDKIFHCSYEKLVSKPKKEIKNLLNYLDLEPQHNCFNPHLNNRPVFTASSIQVRKRIYTDSSNVFKKYVKFIDLDIKNLKNFNS